MRRLLLTSLSFLLVSRSLIAGEPAPRGHLVVVGGGRNQPEFIRHALELGGDAKARVLILPQASELPDAGAKSAALWREQGAVSVAAIGDLRAAGARGEIESASVIWMPGGDQNRLAKAIHEAALADAIRARYRAGAAVLSQLMITGEAELQSITAGATKIAEGLGLWPEVIVDQHFVKRQRQARLLSAVLDHPVKIGVGIDEETAVIVSAAGWKVMGRSSVMIIDARDARHGGAKPGGIASATGLRVHLLKAGMTWKPSEHP